MVRQTGGQKQGSAWKMERASVKNSGRAKPRSNKYRRTADGDKKPGSGERTRAWVGGYTRADGKKVKGHYREITRPKSTGRNGRQQSMSNELQQGNRSR